MPYCPRCRAEYADGVPTCLECDVALIPDRPPPRSVYFDTDDLVMGIGAFVLLMASMGMLVVRYLAMNGQIEPPLGPMLLAAQPQCFVLLFVVGAIASAVALAVAVFRFIFRR